MVLIVIYGPFYLKWAMLDVRLKDKLYLLSQTETQLSSRQFSLRCLFHLNAPSVRNRFFFLKRRKNYVCVQVASSQSKIYCAIRFYLTVYLNQNYKSGEYMYMEIARNLRFCTCSCQSKRGSIQTCKH